MTTDITVSNDQMQAFQQVSGQIGERSRRIYEHDAKAFARFLLEHGAVLSRPAVILYRAFLVDTYAPATAKRMWSVARRIVREQAVLGQIEKDVLYGIPGIKAEDESPHIALTKEQARALLDFPCTRGKQGRDHVLIEVLLRTGIRRFECAALNVGDVARSGEHHVLVIQEGKGKKRRIVKLPEDVWHSIQWLLWDRAERTATDPLFTQYRRGDHPTTERLSAKAIERIVKQYAERAGIEKLTPHGLRASFVTLSIEGGARLEQVQYAAGHADPRTTEGYQKRKLNLDDNAVDYIKL